MKYLIWIEISKQALKNNISVFKKLPLNNVLIAPCVKANAYGHGLVDTARLFLNYGADWLCVNSVFEAEILRKKGVKKPILIIGYVVKKDLKKVIELNAKLVIYNLETAVQLSGLLKNKNKKVPVHIKTDTGMSRQGILPSNLKSFIKSIEKLPGLKLEGLVTHFATSDEVEDNSYFKKQLNNFNKIIKEVKNLKIKYIHASNSAASLLYPEAYFNLIRPGISAYGYYPSEEVAKECRKKNIILKPSLTLKTKIAQIKTVPKGTSISYGCTYTTKKKTTLAVLPIGYYDGIDRRLSNKGEVLIKGKRAKIRGRVCMNIMIVDITGIKNVSPEDEAVIIGRQGSEEITVEEVADKIGTINYEVTTRLRESIKRYYI